MGTCPKPDFGDLSICAKMKCGNRLWRWCDYLEDPSANDDTDQCVTGNDFEPPHPLKDLFKLNGQSEDLGKCTGCLCVKDNCNGAGMAKIWHLGITLAFIFTMVNQ